MISNGFGVISSSDGRGPVVFGQEDVIEDSFESLRPRQLVEYTPVKTPKGWRATRVRVVPHGPP
ncbi:MAG: cold-shock protein [Candidatus Methylomirabilia bacterium]